MGVFVMRVGPEDSAKVESAIQGNEKILGNYEQIFCRCKLHGQCKNGTCLCVTGWNGRHCTIEGCPAQCSSNGECRSNFHGKKINIRYMQGIFMAFACSGDWRCVCKSGWDGSDCSTLLETDCNDGIDNDGGKAWRVQTKYCFDSY